MKPRVLSLFAGIGGFDLGLERAGMQVVAQCEIDPFCQKVLRKHWPDVWMHDDVRTLTGDMVREAVGEVDVICGGYPCQPFSTAGSRKGEDDPRHLWPEFRRLLCDLRPRVALLENVRGHLSCGFARVIADLAESGFDADWTLLSARQFGAWHKRERLFVAAYLNCNGRRKRGSGSGPTGHIHEDQVGPVAKNKPEWCEWLSGAYTSGDTPNANGKRELQPQGCKPDERGRLGHSVEEDYGRGWRVEPDVVRVVYGVPDGMDRVKALGNAIVPQCAEWVGRRVMEKVFPPKIPSSSADQEPIG